MKTSIINLGGEDYSVEFKYVAIIYSVQDMNGKEIEFRLNEDLENEIIDKLNQ